MEQMPGCGRQYNLSSMRYVMATLLLLAVATPVAAHPGVGIVIDPQGNVYYTDLVHVWRIGVDGSRTIAVRNVHSHELAVDARGNLFGEDSRYMGGDRYRHRVWQRTPDGRIIDIIPWRDGFWRQYGFVVDEEGTMYWVQCPAQRCQIRRRSRDGGVSVMADGFGGRINWIAAGPDETVYVVDGNNVRRVFPGGRSTFVARNLGEHVMGLWPERDRRTILAAVYGCREVVRIEEDGRVRAVARSAAPWGPTGVTAAANGDLWILEYSTTNAARVRRVDTAGNSTTF